MNLTAGVVRHQVRNALRGKRRYPYVLMLDPLYTCNLACLGCSVERHTGRIEDRLTPQQCFDALEACEAPTVSLCGGEPMVYPELPELIEGMFARGRHTYVCTNGILLGEKLYGVIPPNKRLTVNVHLDGLKDTHDQVCDRAGVFDAAMEMIAEGKRLGYRVITNTTVYKETAVSELEALCKKLSEMGIDGVMLAPGYEYESVERDMFLRRDETHRKFREILTWSKKYPILTTPLYMEFAAGLRDYKCSPWGTVSFTPRGWKRPCYLIGKTYTFSWDEFWNETDWDYWESREDPLCKNCKMHSGFEVSVVSAAKTRPVDAARLLAWNVLG